jgi:hypothetical protein
MVGDIMMPYAPWKGLVARKFAAAELAQLIRKVDNSFSCCTYLAYHERLERKGHWIYISYPAKRGAERNPQE